jgi:hypothetical protein
MLEFSYEIIKGQLIYDNPQARQKFLTGKDDNYRGFEKHRKPRQSKSNPQLGYYWGLLVPEISKSIIALGWTVTRKLLINGKVFEREAIWDRNGDDKDYTDTHVFLKKEGARIGFEGQHVTLSDQDIEECSNFINNVLFICDNWLHMNMKKLKAKRPKENNNE